MLTYMWSRTWLEIGVVATQDTYHACYYGRDAQVFRRNASSSIGDLGDAVRTYSSSPHLKRCAKSTRGVLAWVLILRRRPCLHIHCIMHPRLTSVCTQSAQIRRSATVTFGIAEAV